jgi:hypothetical protein
MNDPSKIPAERWERYKIKCGQLATDLARLQDIFTQIAAGVHDDQSAYTELCVGAELDGIRDELKNSLDPNYREIPAEEII